MSALLVLVVFVSGFCFTNSYPLARYRQLRSTGWDAYSHIAAWGLLFVVISFPFALLADVALTTAVANTKLGVGVKDISRTFSLSHREIILGLCALVSISSALFAGKAFNTQEQRKRAVKKLAAENAFEWMLYNSAEQVKPVLVTLDSRKIYIGVVSAIASNETVGKTEYFSIVPILSGHRDKDTLRLSVDTSYRAHYTSVPAMGSDTNKSFAQSQIVICSVKVSSLSYFDMDRDKAGP